MAPHVSQVPTENKTFPLNQSLTYAKCGIDVATCVISNQRHVDLIVNKFSTIWLSHQGTWNKPDINDDSGQMALLRYYSIFHGIINKPPIFEAYTATFVKQISLDSLCLSLWIPVKTNGFTN